MRVSQMAQSMYAGQQIKNKLATTAMKPSNIAESKQNQVDLSVFKESQKGPNAFTYGLYTSDGTFLSQEENLRKATEHLSRALQKETYEREKNLAENKGIQQEMEKQEKLFESMSDPVFSMNGYAASASNLMNGRITVEVTISNEQESCKYDRPPHHHGWIHDRHDGWHHHGSPHGGEHEGSEETITLTFVKSLALQSSPEQENTLKINGESIVMNEKGEAMVIMPDDTVRYVKLDQALLDQIAEMNQKEDNDGTGALRIL